MCACPPTRLLRSKRAGSSGTSSSRSPQELTAGICLPEARSPIQNPRWIWNRLSAVLPLATFHHHLPLPLLLPSLNNYAHRPVPIHLEIRSSAARVCCSSPRVRLG